MMDVLVSGEGAAQMLLHDVPVLTDPLAVHRDDSVSSLVDSSIAADRVIYMAVALKSLVVLHAEPERLG